MLNHSVIGQVLVLIVVALAATSPKAIVQDPHLGQQQAIRQIEQAVEQYRKSGDVSRFASELRAVEPALELSYRALLDDGDLSSAALSLSKLGDCRRLQDDYGRAKEYYQQAYDYAKRANNISHQVKALRGGVKCELYKPGSHDYEAVMKVIEEMLRLSGGSDEREDYGDALLLKGQALTALGDFAAAADLLARALSVGTELDDQMMLYSAHLDRADLYVQQAEQWDSRPVYDLCHQFLNLAEKDVKEAVSVAQKLGYHGAAQMASTILTTVEARRSLLNGRQRAGNLLGPRWFSPERPSDVLVGEDFRSATDLTADRPEMKALLQLHLTMLEAKTEDDAQRQYLRGLSHNLQGRTDAALALYLKAADILETDRSKLRDANLRGTFLEDKIQIYYTPLLHLLNRRQIPEAFELMERSRARAMSDLVQSQGLSLARLEDRKLFAERVRIGADISLKRKELLRLRAAPDQPAEKISAAEKEIQRLEGDYQKLLRTVSGSGSRPQELLVSKTASLQSLQQALANDRSEVLYYLVADNAVILWHIAGDAVNVRSVFLPRGELFKKVAKLRKSLENDKSPFDQQTARELFLYLVQPALKWVNTTRLVIVPHEDLNYIPFQVLQDPASGRFLGEHFELSYAPSATLLLGLRRAENLRGASLLAVAASNIPESPRETQTLGKLYPTGSRVVTDPTVAEIKALVGGYDVVHFSCHGHFSGDEPLLSNLDLGSEGGKLTAAEMFGLPLGKARLVTLSACDTGMVTTTRANEILGMQRALLYAGANSLILSSWKVTSEATTLWAESFYREAQTKPLSEAARLALLAVKRHPQYDHPHHWGPFLLIGR